MSWSFVAVPDCAGVYVIENVRDRAVYVGHSKSLRSRFNSHRGVALGRIKSNGAMPDAFAGSDPADWVFRVVARSSSDDRAVLSSLESAAIRLALWCGRRVLNLVCPSSDAPVSPGVVVSGVSVSGACVSYRSRGSAASFVISDGDRVLSYAEAASALGLSPATVASRCRSRSGFSLSGEISLSELREAPSRSRGPAPSFVIRDGDRVVSYAEAGAELGLSQNGVVGRCRARSGFSLSGEISLSELREAPSRSRGPAASFVIRDGDRVLSYAEAASALGVSPPAVAARCRSFSGFSVSGEILLSELREAPSRSRGPAASFVIRDGDRVLSYAEAAAELGVGPAAVSARCRSRLGFSPSGEISLSELREAPSRSRGPAASFVIRDGGRVLSYAEAAAELGVGPAAVAARCRARSGFSPSGEISLSELREAPSRSRGPAPSFVIRDGDRVLSYAEAAAELGVGPAAVSARCRSRLGFSPSGEISLSELREAPSRSRSRGFSRPVRTVRQLPLF